MNCHRNEMGLKCVEADCRLWDQGHDQCYDASVAQAKIQQAEVATSLEHHLGVLSHYVAVATQAFTSIADTQKRYLILIDPPDIPEPETEDAVAWEE